MYYNRSGEGSWLPCIYAECPLPTVPPPLPWASSTSSLSACSPLRSLCLLFPIPRIIFPEISTRWVILIIQFQCHHLGKAFLTLLAQAAITQDWAAWTTEVIVLQFSRLEVRDQGVCRFGTFWGLSPWLADGRLLPASSHGLSPVYVCVLLSSSYKDTIILD